MSQLWTELELFSGGDFRDLQTYFVSIFDLQDHIQYAGLTIFFFHFIFVYSQPSSISYPPH